MLHVDGDLAYVRNIATNSELGAFQLAGGGK